MSEADKMQRIGVDRMRINFLDEKFPKEYKNKLYELENLINKVFKIKSYKFEFDIDWLVYVFTLEFNNFTLCFNFKIEEMNNLSSRQIINIFSKGLQNKTNEIYYKS